MPIPSEQHQQDIDAGVINPDPAQLAAVQALDVLHARLCKQANRPVLLQRLQRRLCHGGHPVTGLYLWGSVGRGKTYLMDLFYNALPFPAKLRLHFYHFMRRVHTDLATFKGTANPLERVAKRFAQQAQVVCFDEFFVTNITDAMLLAGLLQALFQRGVTLVTTSNVPPEGLYKDGLQRAQFLPAIDLLQQHLQVWHLESAMDYRMRTLSHADRYRCPHNEEAEQHLLQTFEQLARGPHQADEPVQICGRTLITVRLAEDVIWFQFAQLCDGPRSQEDYIDLAHRFATLILSNVPKLTADQDDQARRFIALIDELYDRRVKLLITAEAPAAEIYSGNRLNFEFERTVSRLIEMQTLEYIQLPHRP